MNFKAVIKKEPIATFSLLISISVALFSSPIFLDWYFGPKVVVVADFKQSNDQRCAPFKLLIRNEGSRTAENVFLLYDSDFFTLRGDITGYYSGDEPLFSIRKRVDYISNVGEIRIPKLGPGQDQEFLYLEIFNDSQVMSRRNRLIQDREKSVLNFPRIVLAGHDGGKAQLTKVNNKCEDQK